MKENHNNELEQAAYRIAYLIAGFIRNCLSEKEHQELDNWVNESDHNMQLFEELTDERNLQANIEWLDNVQTEQSFNELIEKEHLNMKRIKIKFRPVWLAAASLILLLSSYFIFKTMFSKPANNQPIAIKDTTGLYPGGNQATLTLENGATYDLSSAKNGVVTEEGAANIIKLSDGFIAYVPQKTELLTYPVQILSTPTGGQYQVTLTDSTKVWLNSATTLRFPAQFSGGERRVELDGEAYFEVSKNKKQPFRVYLKDGSILTVLGTHFNVMAYENEIAKEITLVEGKVSVKKNSEMEELMPGTQARISGNEITKITGIDTTEITGWIHGRFVFHDSSIETIMKQVERWYGAKVIYESNNKNKYNATILRSEPLTKLLHLLELTGYVHFKIENKTIYVLP